MTKESENFSYSTTPQPLKPFTKKKYKDDKKIENLNILSDPRVVKGSTLAAARKISNLGNHSTTEENNRHNKDINAMKSKPNENHSAYYSFNPSSFTQDGVEILSHLIEQPNESINTSSAEVFSQTDFFIHQPPSPKYIPKKTGIDRYTQVEDVRDLFLFDEEVIPILEVITSKTIEQALFEIRCEEDLKQLTETQNNYLKIQSENAEWTKQSISNDIQEKASKAKEIALANEQYNAMLRLKTLVACLAMSRQIRPSVLDDLFFNDLYSKDKGAVWKDPDVEAVKEILDKDIIEEKSKRILTHLENSKELLDGVIASVLDRFDEATPKPRSGHVHKIEISFMQTAAAAAGDGDGADSDIAVTAAAGAGTAIRPWSVQTHSTIQHLVDYINNTQQAPGLDVGSGLLPRYSPDAAVAFFSKLLGRSIAADAPLRNFTLPKSITMQI